MRSSSIPSYETWNSLHTDFHDPMTTRSGRIQIGQKKRLFLLFIIYYLE
jgi:hypothetical protein